MFLLPLLPYSSPPYFLSEPFFYVLLFLTYLALFVFLTFLCSSFNFIVWQNVYLYISKFYTTKYKNEKLELIFSSYIRHFVAGGACLSSLTSQNLRIHTLLLFWCTFFLLVTCRFLWVLCLLRLWMKPFFGFLMDFL